MEEKTAFLKFFTGLFTNIFGNVLKIHKNYSFKISIGLLRLITFWFRGGTSIRYSYFSTIAVELCRSNRNTQKD